MNIVGIIPARFASTRLPGKLLMNLVGKPVIQHVYENTKNTKLLNKVIVATDNNDIYETIKKIKGDVVLTGQYNTGTDRIAEVAKSVNADVIVNIQGDEPLINSDMIDELVSPFFKNSSIDVATLVHEISDVNDLSNPNIVKAVIDNNRFAVYFSRSPIPYPYDYVFKKGNSGNGKKFNSVVFYKHIGVYAYNKDFLMEFVKLPSGDLERAEHLEQLRILENGYKIKVVPTKYDSISLDTPEDLKKIEKIMKDNNK